MLVLQRVSTEPDFIIIKDLTFNTAFIILTVITPFFLDSTNFCPNFS